MRIPGWQRELNVYLLKVQDKYKKTGFKWGELDCFHFVGDWVHTLTGVDYMKDYRGKYSTESEAMSLLETEGSIYEALEKRFGPPIHPAKAHRGDIAYTDDALGIFLTSGARMIALFLGKGGFTSRPAKDVPHAFKVR